MSPIRAWLTSHLADPPDTDDCVIWPFAKTHNGHAVIDGTTVARVLLGLAKGDGLVARHTCHVPDCVNPRHLVPGTPADNSRDMVDAGRSLAGQRNPNYVHGRETGQKRDRRERRATTLAPVAHLRSATRGGTK